MKEGKWQFKRGIEYSRKEVRESLCFVSFCIVASLAISPSSNGFVSLLLEKQALCVIPPCFTQTSAIF